MSAEVQGDDVRKVIGEGMKLKPVSDFGVFGVCVKHIRFKWNRVL